VAISGKHVTNVCKPKEGPACAFMDTNVYTNGIECSKGTILEDTIRRRMAEGTMGHSTDNCPGWDKVNHG
jgi:hypothetical protein